MNGVLDTYLQETLGGHQSTLQKNREKWGGNWGNLGKNEAQKLHDLSTRPKK